VIGLDSDCQKKQKEGKGMTRTGSAPASVNCAYIVSTPADVDIERFCREVSEGAHPPEAFLVTSKAIAGALLGVSLEFLEQGQLMPWPGVPLVGATFDPDWGFARAVIGFDHDGSADFRLPPGPFDTEGDHDTYGYRMCPIHNNEIPEAIKHLAHIRAELAKPRQERRQKPGIEVTLTHL
jgi:hypothetical protein